MSARKAPRLETRRAEQFAAELLERARAWIPSWGLAEGEGDFGAALLDVAARFSSEVAERLDGAGDKMHLGFLDWLAVRGEAARPARVPAVFKLADATRTPVLATKLVRLQADVGGVPVTFETEKDVQLVPGRLEAVIGVDGDAFYLPPPGLSSLDPLAPLPTQWRLKTFAAAQGTRLQLDPELGLAPEMLLEAAGAQYRVVEVEKNIATIDPPLAQGLAQGSVVRKAGAFAPFDAGALNRQEHALYLGHMELLDMESPGTLEVVGARQLADASWQYWGKAGTDPEAGWKPLVVADADEQVQPDALLLEKETQGAVEPRPLNGGAPCRWIRAVKSQVDPDARPFQADALALRVNCSRTPLACPAPAGKPSPAAEAMANTQPLVLDGVFYPLGKEPRQFDAFYLGSAEAFSKKGAEVQLCFEMADPTVAAFSVVRDGEFKERVVAGIGRDRALHFLELDPVAGTLGKFREREPLQPPLPAFGGAAPSGVAVPLDAEPGWRPPLWHDGDDLLAAVSSGARVWIWREVKADRDAGGWLDFGEVPGTGEASPRRVDDLACVAEAAGPMLVALRDGQLSSRKWPGGTEWTRVQTKEGANPVVLKAIAPVVDDKLRAALAAGLVGISADGKLYAVSAQGTCAALDIGASVLDTSIRPAAMAAGGATRYFAVSDDGQKLIGADSSGPASAQAAIGEAVVGTLLDVAFDGTVAYCLATVSTAQGFALAAWAPFPLATAPGLLSAGIGQDVGQAGGAPSVIDGRVLVPGTRGDVLTATFDLGQRRERSATIEAGIVVPASPDALVPGDRVALDAGTAAALRTITDFGLTRDGETFYPIDSRFPAPGAGPLLAYRASAVMNGAVDAADKLRLQVDDRSATESAWLLVDGAFRQVTAIDRGGNPWIATVTPATLATTDPGSYVVPLRTGGRAAPFMRLDPAGSGDFDAAVLATAELSFPGAVPARQKAKAFSLAAGNRPVIVALGADWSTVPSGTRFFLEAVVGAWNRLLAETASNPELSWEYWNGKAWWKLGVTLDQTLHLKNTGAVRFKVPSDIAAGDWSGKNNHWIRARLVGGDFGREEVTLTTTPGPDNTTVQKVERSSRGIRPPSVVRLHISYSLCEAVPPTLVYAQDSGSTRDQSDANRTAGAIVEAFVPLPLLLGRLESARVHAQDAEKCPPLPCDCPGAATQSGEPAPAAREAAGRATAAQGGRALFLGLTLPPSGGPVNVLMLVSEERSHDAVAPIQVDALVADGFVPLAASDATRALGETGIVSMSFAVPPAPRDLFGRTLSWLRLTPRRGAQATWSPTLAGVYLNAVWADAAETLTRELLGSSEGAPHLTLTLARPPLLRRTLELRVLEPLGDEERAQLRRQGTHRVVGDERGDWVLWDEVTDPLDEPPTRRAYALDEATGEVRFGDGEHGLIPPVGRDSIVAFSYRRAGVAGSDAVPGNAIAARAKLNLVSAVAGVEAVFAADHAAGGAPAEAVPRVLRFGTARLRHRNRAVTARDLEDLALQSSPDIVQAVSFVGRGSVRLVVVMAGADPRPNAAQLRELRRVLLAAAPASLAASGALRIDKPGIRRLRLALRLRVASLDDAGAVRTEVGRRIQRLFDTAAGGMDSDGWRLGESPDGEDIGVELADLPRLEGIAGVDLLEVLADGSERPWPATIAAAELAVLHPDPLRVQFETVEVLE